MTTYEPGQTLYWSREPGAKFVFVKMNRDGSVQMYGGDKGFGHTRDARPEEVSTSPAANAPAVVQSDRIGEWAVVNLGAEVTPVGLADDLNLSHWTVRKYLLNHPDLFKRIGRGLYRVRTEEDAIAN